MLHLSNLENTSVEERVTGLKRLSFEEFLRLILILRKKYRIGESNEKSKTFIKNHDLQKNVTAFWLNLYIGPEEPLQELRKIYEQGIQDLSSETLEEFALQIYMGITLGQVFYDGNGRTAILLYNYLLNGEFQDLRNSIETKSDGGKFLSPHKEFLFYISIKGVETLFREKGIITDQEHLDTLNDGNSEKISVKIRKDGRKLMGNEAFIFFLAFCDNFRIDYGKAIKSDQIWDLDMLFTSPKEKDEFEKRAQGYIKEAFQRSLAYAQDNSKRLVRHINGNIQDIFDK